MSELNGKEIALFEEKYLQQFKELGILAKKAKEIECTMKAIKEQIEPEFIKYNIKKLDNQYITITLVAGSESTSIDLKKLQDVEPELYDELLRDYPKTTKRKAYIKMAGK